MLKRIVEKAVAKELQEKLQIIERRRDEAKDRRIDLSNRLEVRGLSTSPVEMVRMQKNLEHHRQLLGQLKEVGSALQVLDNSEHLSEEKELLTRELAVLGYKPGFSIYDGSDSAGLIRELMKQAFADPGNQAEQMLWQISRWKSAFIQPEQAMQEANGNALLTAAAALYEKYNHHLKTYNAVDFDDLLMFAVQLLEQHPDLQEHYCQRFQSGHYQ